MDDQSVLNEIVPVLKTYIELSDKDRETTKVILDKLDHSIDAMRECSVNMKLQIKTLETHSEMFTSSCRDRKDECEKKFDRLEGKLGSIPSKEMASERDKKIDVMATEIKDLAKEVRNLSIKVYVIIATGAGIFSFVKWGLPFFLSFAKKAGG